MIPKTPDSKEALIILKLRIEKNRRVKIVVCASLYTIDWGDQILNSCEVHDYKNHGEYIVQIQGKDISKLKFSTCFCTEAKIQNCLELISIDCTHNPLEKIQIIDCPNILHINCSNCQLREFIIPEVQELRSLNCSNNNIRKLNLSGAANLIVLDAYNNSINKLNLKGCECIVSINIENNRFQVLDLNNLFESLSKQITGCNAYINFAGNPGESSCDNSILGIKSWKIGKITDPISFEDIKTTDNSSLKNPSVNKIPDSIIHLTLSIEGPTEVLINTNAKHVLYVWSSSEVSMGHIGQHTFIPSYKLNEKKDLYIFAEKLISLNIEKTSCTNIEIQSPTIKALNVNSTKIEKLDLSNTPELICLECTDTPLKQLDLSPCKELNVVTCSNNQLHEIKTTGLSNMQYLDCSGNQLTQLNLALCTHLRTVNLTKNNISEINILGCKSLRFIHCENNQLKNLNSIFEQLPTNDDPFLLIENGKKINGHITYDNNPGSESADKKILRKKQWLANCTKYENIND